MTTQRKRIVFVLPALMSGGAERVLITLMNGLDRKKFDPHFITVSPAGELRPLIAADIPFISLDCKRVLTSIPHLIAALRRLNPDIVVSTMFHMNAACLLCRPFLPRAKFIIREAIVPSFFLTTKKATALIKTVYRLAYPWAHTIISPAQRIIDEFAQVIGLRVENHALLYNPVDVARIRAIPLAQPMTDERKNTVHFICAGRLVAQKGFDRLIEALPWLPADMQWKLTILGEGPDHASLQDKIDQLGLKDRVTLGGLSLHPWPQMAAADMFLLPSRWEGLPNVALEALGVGTPVIAMRDAGGIDEIASLCPAGVVQVVDTIQDFIEAMRAVRPTPSLLHRPSLLPDIFTLEKTVDRFTSILEGTAPPFPPLRQTPVAQPIRSAVESGNDL